MQVSRTRRILAENVRIRRMELGLTQTSLAKATKASQALISRIESEERTGDIDFLDMLAKALKTTPDALLREKIFASVA